jgi:hypothetical protein
LVVLLLASLLELPDVGRELALDNSEAPCGSCLYDLDEPRARALVQQLLDTMEIRGDDAWVITTVGEYGWGWVISL